MKKQVSVIYSIFAILVFIFSIGYFGYNIFTEYNSGAERTRRRFEHLSNTIQNVSNEKNLNLLNARIVKAVGDTDDFSYLDFKKNDVSLYSYKTENSESKSRLIKTYSKNFKIENDYYTLNSNLYLLRPATIYYYAKISFLIVLFVTLITFILILTTKPSKNESKSEKDKETKSNIRPEFNVISEKKVDSTNNSINESKTEQEVTQNTEVSKSTTSVSYKLPNEDLKPLDIVQDDNYDANPAGLFSPLTGFGWESYLITRLNSELNRATSSEFDLSLFIFKFPEISRTDDRIATICEYLLSNFQFKDLLFEYKEDSFVAIKIASSIDEAIELADTIYKSVKDFIGEANCYIGISSRTIRMIDGERLLKEAEKALEIAQEDNSNPIVAFRADAEKFRKFEETKSN